jgi:regulator of sigma D
VHFEKLVQNNESIGQQDEIKRIYQMMEELRKELVDFKRQATEKEEAKEKEVRTLQEAMGAMP